MPQRSPAKPRRLHQPTIVRTIPALAGALSKLRKRGERLALVPTMGALHDGHLSLVRLARKHADRIAVSIFVNPTQFAAHEDLGSYPRTFEADVERLAAEKVDLVWAPTSTVMYPSGFATRITPEGPALAGLEDRFRPHFSEALRLLLRNCLPSAVPTSRFSARRIISSSRS